MRRAIDKSAARVVIQTASELVCPHCDKALSICQHRDRLVYRLDGPVYQNCRDKRCLDKECQGHETLYRPLVDVRLALPYMSYGLDVVLYVGEGHLRQGLSFSEMSRRLGEQGVLIHQTHVGRLFRVFLALCQMARGDQEQVRQRLRAQGGIVLMVDGVQFDASSPVLYLAWDSVSGTPLFAVRMEDRSAAALSEVMMRVKQMGVPVVGVVTDAEKGLVPAVQKVFPDVPHQLCQTHFLKNCAEPMEQDLKDLGASVGQRAEQVRKLQKRLDKKQGRPGRDRDTVRSPAAATPPSPPSASPAAATPAPAAATPPSPPPASPAAATPAPAAATPAPAAATPPSPPPAPAAVTPSPSGAAPSHVHEAAPVHPCAEPLTEEELVRQLSSLVRLGARRSGKAPLNPPDLVRHQQLEQVRQAALEAAKKKTARPPT